MKLCGKLFEITEKPPQPEEPAIPPRPGRPGRSGSYLSFSKMIVVLILLTVTKSKVLIFSDIFFTYISIILHVFTIFYTTILVAAILKGELMMISWNAKEGLFINTSIPLTSISLYISLFSMNFLHGPPLKVGGWGQLYVYSIFCMLI